MKTKTLQALVFEDSVAFKKLFAGEAVLRLFGFADDGVAFLERAGVVAEAHEIGEFAAESLLEVGNVRDVIEVDDRTELVGLTVFVGRRVVRGEDDLFALDADGLTQGQFSVGRAIAAHPLISQNFEHVRRIDRLGAHRQRRL